MKPITDDSTRAQQKVAGQIPIPTSLREGLRFVNDQEVELLFMNLRLNLQGRILGLDDRELIKLQGKLEYLSELEKFFYDL